VCGVEVTIFHVPQPPQTKIRILSGICWRCWPFAEELVIPAVESNAVVPDLSGKINRLEPLGSEEREFERLTH
jgi:hypothetical protein